jgi:putative NADH-flavin reductase
MKILVFGATGRIGRQVTRSATERGHHVIAFVHQPDPVIAPGLNPAQPDAKAITWGQDVTVMTGDLLDPATLARPVAAADAVVFAVGLRGHGPVRVRSAGIAAVIKEMRAAGVSRLVAVSPSAVAISPRATLARKIALRNFIHKLNRNPFLDVERMEDELRLTDLNWSVIRAAPVRDWPATGQYEVVPDGQLRRERPVSAADLGDFIVAHTTGRGQGRDTVIVTGVRGRRPREPRPAGNDPRDRPAVPDRPSAQKEGQAR